MMSYQNTNPSITTSWAVRVTAQNGLSQSNLHENRQDFRSKPATNGHAVNRHGLDGKATMAPGKPSTPSLHPPKLLAMYDDFITKNAGSVGQIENALRSLTYVIPGRFREAEIASETLHSGVQLLSLYHDALLRRVKASQQSPTPSSCSSTISHTPQPMPSAHARYTKYWTAKSPTYRRVALLLQMVKYTELLCEMTAKRRGGERSRWRVVVILEMVKAVCRLVLLQVTKSRPLLIPALPQREPIPAADDGTEEQDQESTKALSDLLGEDISKEWEGLPARAQPKDYETPWLMPRTGMSLPSLPKPTDISAYLLERVLTADDIKPAQNLLNPAPTNSARAAEVLHILAPLIYAILLARAQDKKRAWHPWVVGLLVELAARQLRDRGIRTTGLERDEWMNRAWSMGWWGMRGVFYDTVMKNVVGGVKRRVPRLIGGILEDYEYLWENYYYSTSE